MILTRLPRIRYKILTVMIVVLLLSCVVSAFAVQRRTTRVLMNQSDQLWQQLLTSGAEKIDERIYALDDVYRSLYLSETFRAYLASMDRPLGTAQYINAMNGLKSLFLSTLSSRSDLYAIIYADSSGRLIFTTRNHSDYFRDYHIGLLPDAMIDYMAKTIREAIEA